MVEVSCGSHRSNSLFGNTVHPHEVGWGSDGVPLHRSENLAHSNVQLPPGNEQARPDQLLPLTNQSIGSCETLTDPTLPTGQHQSRDRRQTASETFRGNTGLETNLGSATRKSYRNGGEIHSGFQTLHKDSIRHSPGGSTETLQRGRSPQNLLYVGRMVQTPTQKSKRSETTRCSKANQTARIDPKTKRQYPS